MCEQISADNSEHDVLIMRIKPEQASLPPCFGISATFVFRSIEPSWEEGRCQVLLPPLGSLPFHSAFVCFTLLYCNSIMLRFWSIFSWAHTSSVSFRKTAVQGFSFLYSFTFLLSKAASIIVNNSFILMVLKAFSTPPRRSEKHFRKGKGGRKSSF